jgi:hypothetical protein
MPKHVDQNFTDALKHLTGIDQEQMLKVIPELSIDDLLELMDTVTEEDGDRAKAILEDNGVQIDVDEQDEKNAMPDDRDLNSLLRGKPDREHTKKMKSDHRRKRHEIEEDEDLGMLSVGDNVIVDDEEGTVKIPNGPGKTVGVIMDGKLRMVDRNKVHRVDENVMGMTPMLNIARIRELAGILDVMPAPISGKTLLPGTIDFGDEVDSDTECDAAERVHEALECLEECLPLMTVAEFPKVRVRLEAIMGSLFNDPGT